MQRYLRLVLPCVPLRLRHGQYLFEGNVRGGVPLARCLAEGTTAEASDVNAVSGLSFRDCCIIERPFQCWTIDTTIEYPSGLLHA